MVTPEAAGPHGTWLRRLARPQSGLASGSEMPPLSVLVLLPAFLLAGDWLTSARPRARFAYLALSGSLLILASILFAL